jgi:7-cyano-7-deazaguanine synthase
MTDVVAIISGGMDSAVMLWQLVDAGASVLALSFDYRQRHIKELEAAVRLTEVAKVRHHIAHVELPRVSALQGKGEVPEGHYADQTMKATVVPSRNLVFLALATAHAVAESADAVAYAAHGGDHTIYPDCRPEFVKALGEACYLANWHPVRLAAPFIRKSKADLVRLGTRLAVPFELTWSCYKGGDLHCGKCGTCVERREAFELAGVIDPTEYEA